MGRPAYKFDYISTEKTPKLEPSFSAQILPLRTPVVGRRSLGRYIQPIGMAMVDVAAMLSAVIGVALVAGLVQSKWSVLLSGVNEVFVFLFFVGVAVACFTNRGHYSRRKPFWNQCTDILRVIGILAVVQVVLLSLSQVDYSRSTLLFTWAAVMVLLPIYRACIVKRLNDNGSWGRRTLIVGCGPNAIETAEALRDERFLGSDVIGFIAMPGEELPGSGYIELADRCVPVTSLNCDPVTIVRSLNCWNVVVALENECLSRHQSLIKQLNRGVRNVTIVPALRGLPLYGMEVEHFFRHELLLLNVRNNLARPTARFLKRAFDIGTASVLLVLLSPLFGYFSWKIHQSAGSVFYGHNRIGENGKPFKCYKFRSMVPNAERVLKELLENNPEAKAQWERDFKLKDDPRITPIGQFLRKSSLDELPQLWNVLKGEMSLVGPRPIVRDEVSRYDEDIDYYLEVKPGISGLWQVSGRNDTGYENRVRLDAWYVRNWSLWYDIVILFKTVKVVLARSGAY